MTTIQKKARWRGNNYERRVAKLIHGTVVGRSKAIKVSTPIGDRFVTIDPQHPPDCINVWISAECKYLKVLKKCITDPLDQSIRNAPAGLVPIVFMGDREGHRLVIMSEKDFLELHEEGK
jgi:hypothetical protein